MTSSSVEQLSPDEVRKRAATWYERQLQLAAAAHGNAWPEHREWVEDYLKEELRLRLIARGWRPKQ